MIVRKFRPGQRVQLQSGGPIMVVQKYQRERNLFLGTYESNCMVECTWLDTDGYKRRNFHQNHLIKAIRNYQRNNTEKRESIQK